MVMVSVNEILEEQNSFSSACTSESSDSYSYLLHDFETQDNHITEEWEAIERTLYQENGKHVTDPLLLKECKLWRETFPHFRVTGTAIKTSEENTPVTETKNVDVKDKNQLELSKILEKREKIKETIVSQIVERLINKLNLNSESFENNLIMSNREKGKDNKMLIINNRSSGIKQEKESYFERGKEIEIDAKDDTRKFLTEANVIPNDENSLSYLFDDFENNFTYGSLKAASRISSGSLWTGSCYTNTKEPTTTLAKNERLLRSGNLKFKITEKSSSSRTKTEKSPDSLSSIMKPFEATKKIDKKYEVMLGRILENKGIQNSKTGMKSEGCTNALEKSSSLRTKKQLPKLNNFTNNWLSRADRNLYEYKESIGGNYGDATRNLTNNEKHFKSQSCRSASRICKFDEKIFGELKKEVNECTIASTKDYEEINLRRPQLQSRYNSQNNTAKTQKSLSCSDLPKNKTIRATKGNSEKGKNELILKKKSMRNAGNPNLQLPPIETSIICTEIIARPKVTTKTLTKRYL